MVWILIGTRLPTLRIRGVSLELFEEECHSRVGLQGHGLLFVGVDTLAGTSGAALIKGIMTLSVLERLPDPTYDPPVNTSNE